jgi:recombination protein RecA
MFGNPETTPGGRALKFYASVRLDIRRIETLKEGVEAIGNRIRVKVVKNKVAPPFRQAEFDIMYGTGFSWEGTVIDVATERKVVTKSGSYFSFGDERLGQGRQNATAFLREHPDVTQSILQQIQLEVGPEQVVSARLLPVAVEEAATNGSANGSTANGRAAKAAAAAALVGADGADE